MTKLIAPAGTARPGPPLSPILGQAQIKVADFVTQFNAATAGYTPGFPLGCRVTRVGGTKFTLVVRPPAVALLLIGVASGRVLARADLWDCLRFRWGGVTPTVVATGLGTAKSLGLQVR